MATSQNFIINGVNSSDIGLNGVSIIRTDGGMFNSAYMGGLDIVEETVPYRTNPVFYRVQRRPIEFSLKFSFLEDLWTPDRLYEFASHFSSDTYVEFQTCDDLGKYYYVLCPNQSDITTNGMQQGWVELTLRTNASHAWSTIYEDQYDLSNNTSTQMIQLKNLSNISKYGFLYPEIEIKLLDTSTGFSLKNYNDGGRIVSFTGLNLLETIYLNGDRKEIISSTGLYRYNNWNKNWLRLPVGTSNIEVTGKCLITTRMRYALFV